MSYYRPQGQANGPVPYNKPKPPARRVGCGGVLGAGIVFLVLTLLIFGGLLFGYVGIAAALPAPEELQARANTFASTQIYDRDGNLLNEIADPNYGRRTLVTLDQISPYLKEATLATEDPNFYQHPGVDPVGIARVVYYAIRNRDITSGPGGSTITQQLVKLTFLSSERTVSRKIKEGILAAEITRRYSKDTILQIYLNEIYYGNLAYGVEAASQTYFGKSAGDLTLAEAAMIAGLPQAPAYYDPYTKLFEADGVTPSIVKKRQGVVLGLMVKHGSITSEQADAAWREPLQLRPLQQSYTMQDPHFVLYVRDQVEKVVGPELMAKGGLRIYSTLDPHIQGIAQEEVSKQVAALARQGASNGAVVAVRPSTGEILAMVGSADFKDEKISGQINMATAPRQPGSSIKPLTYLAAFEMPPAAIDPKASPSDQVSAIEPPGYWTPGTAIMDIRTEFPDGANPPYVPTNYDGKDHGLVTVRSALANSYNVPAVKALQHVGLDGLKNMASRLDRKSVV
jgi:membrane peptidoglycan carboxypeptidase